MRIRAGVAAWPFIKAHADDKFQMGTETDCVFQRMKPFQHGQGRVGAGAAEFFYNRLITQSEFLRLTKIKPGKTFGSR